MPKGPKANTLKNQLPCIDKHLLLYKSLSFAAVARFQHSVLLVYYLYAQYSHIRKRLEKKKKLRERETHSHIHINNIEQAHLPNDK